MTTETTKKVDIKADERLDIKRDYSIHADDVQKRSLNDIVKTEKEQVKVIVREDGSIQAVGVNETNVDDEHPNLQPVAEITPTIQTSIKTTPTSEEVLNDGTPDVSVSEMLEDAEKTAVHDEVKPSTVTETKVVKQTNKKV